MWIVFALSAAVIWGLDYALAERILAYKISPTTLLALQVLIGCVLFTSIAYCTQLKHDITMIKLHPKLLGLLVAAVLSFNLGNLLIILSIKASNATLAAMIELCYPLFTLIFAWVLFRVNQFSPAVLAGGLLIFAGILIITRYGH